MVLRRLLTGAITLTPIVAEAGNGMVPKGVTAASFSSWALELTTPAKPGDQWGTSGRRLDHWTDQERSDSCGDRIRASEE